MLSGTAERIVIHAEGRLSSQSQKLILAPLLYIPERVVAVIDSTKAGGTVQEQVGFGGEIPVVASLSEALAYQPDSLLLASTSIGGVIPQEWHEAIRLAIETGMTVINGLQQHVNDIPDFVHVARTHNVRLIDLLRLPKSHQIKAQASWRLRTAKTILTVGTDSDTGKMTTGWRMYREMVRRGLSVTFLGTGPAGIVLGRRGVAAESIPAEYATGAHELEVDKAAHEGSEYIVIEGQGALTNCANSPIALGILHGVMPDAMVLSHRLARDTDGFGLALPSLEEVIALHERLVAPFTGGRIVGIGLNSMDVSNTEAQSIAASMHTRTGLVAVDPLRKSAAPLVDALLSYFSTYRKTEFDNDAAHIPDRDF